MRADPSERRRECGRRLRRLGRGLPQEPGRAELAAPLALARDQLAELRPAVLSLAPSLFFPAGESHPWSPAFSAASNQTLYIVSLPPCLSPRPPQGPGAKSLCSPTLGPTETGGSSSEVSSLILNREFWAAQTLMSKGTREALRAVARGTGEDELPGTLPRNENWGAWVVRCLRRERRKGRTRERKEEPGRNGRELREESGGGVKTGCGPGLGRRRPCRHWPVDGRAG